jgi:hypothetical protein
MLARRIMGFNDNFMQKGRSLEDMTGAAEAIYAHVMHALPREHQRSFENVVSPKLADFLGVIEQFKGRLGGDESDNKAGV